MYPQEELRLLASARAELCRRIHARRLACSVAASRLSRPIERLDRMLATWRRLSPALKLAAVPLALLLKRWIAPKTRILSSILRWGPVAYGAVRGLTGARKLSHRG
jgi:hypothetical protein